MKLCIYLLTLFSLFSCSKSPEEITDVNKPNTPNEDFIGAQVLPTGEEQYLQLNSDYIFDQNTLHTIELYLKAADLEKIDADPAREEYVEGTLIFQGDTISPVGIRYKGSIGAFVGCVSGNDWANPSGYKTCPKLSMKVKINWEEREEKFYGLKKLQLHSMNNDPSQMRERLGYYLFREMGVPAPRAVHAKLMINGEYSGLYALVEQVDGRFSRYNFNDGKGNVYKEIWPLNSNGQPFSEQRYIQSLETNEDESPDVSLIRNFAVALSQANSLNQQRSIVENNMNIDEALSYCVVDRMIRHDDGPFHWYCSGNNCSPHNFYWYEEPVNKKLHLIPWDLDNAFENIINNANPVTPIADAWGETRNNCQPFFSGFFAQKSAACDKLVETWANYTLEYDLKRSQMKTGVFSESNINTQLETWRSQIELATEEAKLTHEDALSLSKWNAALDDLKGQCTYARNN